MMSQLCLYTSIVVCQSYEGYEFCHDVDGYSHGNWTVYVDRSRSEWETLALDFIDLYLKNLLAQITVDIGDDVWTPGCDHKVRQLLCHSTLPFCKKQGEQGKGGHINWRETWVREGWWIIFSMYSKRTSFILILQNQQLLWWLAVAVNCWMSFSSAPQRCTTA